jgi:hypothetical protein
VWHVGLTKCAVVWRGIRYSDILLVKLINQYDARNHGHKIQGIEHLIHPTYSTVTILTELFKRLNRVRRVKKEGHPYYRRSITLDRGLPMELVPSRSNSQYTLAPRN